jgi:tRNA-splicing ligase RtcB
VRFDTDAAPVEDSRIASLLFCMFDRELSTRQRGGRLDALPESLVAQPLSAGRLTRKRDRIGRRQLGTLGRGNHFLELQRDEQGRLWLMVHTGSRGMGQAIREHHLRAASTARTGLRYLEADNPAGLAYLADAAWALEYAEHNRAKLVEAAARCLERAIGARSIPDSYFDCHHNFVRQEQHGGQPLWVHRKGAISASDDEPGIIPGSMGTESFHVTGRGHPDALRSSSHGAGRAMSRTEARHRISRRVLKRQMRGVWFDPRRANGLREEAPAAYKDIGAVMRAQRPLTRITRRLTPMLVFKE